MSTFPSTFDVDTWERWLQERRKRFLETSLFNRDRLSLSLISPLATPIPTPDESAALFQFPKLSISSDKSKPLTTVDKDGFTACIDIQHFKPEQITVKTVKDTIIVEAKHEDQEDEHGFISRSFYRKYILPPGYDPKTVVSTLSSDGVLTIKAPNPVAAIDDKERVIEIQKTGASKPAPEKPEK
ncbi:unnamed protein product [Hermetia illucens]|uniref:SHSP domain-containing protein n=1 Tax=Hermetia illucens TaxID=343691 RepID=A0A7R8YRI8_HERIL|nr:heat shock protein 27-like [Hermetia illucens]CAD7082743.1 unnamed protein product [Hermetia illucens]